MGDGDETNDELLIRFGALHLDDIEINNQGFLSDRQLQSLQYHSIFWIMLISLEFITILLIIGFQIYIRSGFSVVSYWIVMLGISITASYGNARPFWDDIEAGRIKTVSGILTKRAFVTGGSGGRGNTRQGFCTVRVQHEVFTISPLFYDLLIDQSVYRLYFTPKTRKVMNIDHIRS